MPIIYTVKEAAEACRTNKETIYKAIRSGELRALKIGHTKISEESLMEYIRRKEGRGN